MYCWVNYYNNGYVITFYSIISTVKPLTIHSRWNLFLVTSSTTICTYWSDIINVRHVYFEDLSIMNSSQSNNGDKKLYWDENKISLFSHTIVQRYFPFCCSLSRREEFSKDKLSACLYVRSSLIGPTTM
jgi:hypothetical protein